MILMKDIVREGHDTLYKVAEEVQLPMSQEDQDTLRSMLQYVENSVNDEIAHKYQLRPSVGIAAPQINISKKMIAVFTTDEKDEKLYRLMMVNPKIVSHSEELTYLPTGEGCLSVDREVQGYVMRNKRITVETHLMNDDGSLEKVRLRLKGYIAIVVQHEIDHLNGIMFTDHINKENPFFIPENANPIQFGG